jgi:hypothetical protein
VFDTGRDLNDVTELRKAIESPAENFPGRSECKGVVLAKRNRLDSVPSLGEGHEPILRMLAGTQTIEPSVICMIVYTTVPTVHHSQSHIHGYYPEARM